MFLVLKKRWQVPHVVGVGNCQVVGEEIIHPGQHEIERIPNPLGYPGSWLVLKGTLTGATEGFWRQWQNEPGGADWGDWEVVIEE